MCFPLLCPWPNHSRRPWVVNGLLPIRTCLPRARHALLQVLVGSARWLRWRGHETAAIRQASLAFHVAPVLRASLLPPHSPRPVPVKHSFVRAPQLAVQRGDPARSVQRALPTAVAQEIG